MKTAIPMTQHALDVNRAALRRAVTIAGGVRGLARLLGVKTNTVYQWIKRGRCGLASAQKIQRLTGVRVTDLRADVFDVGELWEGSDVD